MAAQTEYSYVIIGSGGHARVLLDTLRMNNIAVAALLDVNPDRCGQSLMDVPILPQDELTERFTADTTLLVNGVGGVKNMQPRKAVFTTHKELGYSFATLVHPAAFVADDVILEEGAQIMAGAVIITGSTIGANTIINTRATIDHDCSIGAHTHIAPGSALSGGITVGECSLVGTGVSVIQGICIGNNAVAGAGAAVVKDIPDNAIAVGVPATIR